MYAGGLSSAPLMGVPVRSVKLMKKHAMPMRRPTSFTSFANVATVEAMSETTELGFGFGWGRGEGGVIVMF